MLNTVWHRNHVGVCRVRPIKKTLEDSLDSGLWVWSVCRVLGSRSQVSGLRSQVLGPKSQVPGPRSQVHPPTDPPPLPPPPPLFLHSSRTHLALTCERGTTVACGASSKLLPTSRRVIISNARCVRGTGTGTVHDDENRTHTLKVPGLDKNNNNTRFGKSSQRYTSAVVWFHAPDRYYRCYAWSVKT